MLITDPDRSGQVRTERFVGLLAEARQGNRESLGQLLQWYTSYLNLLANTQLDRRLRRRMNPSDIVQEAMLAAHRDFAGFRGQTQAELLCWMRTILIHVLRRNFDRHVKVEKRDIRREVSIDTLAGDVDRSAARLATLLPDRGDSPSAALRSKESELELADRLSQLKPDHRQVIVLRVLRGLPFEDIATEMNRSNGAVRMLWLRALDAFKSLNGSGDGRDES